ncbi:MAG: phosphatidate cytidylyltransferase, partial [Neisseriaceae bacterium]|nr:phosphatidate cytidylyltransferase [Neisseriaceae bacterium]
MLKQRIWTAAILIPLVILAIYFLPLFYFFLVGCVITVLCAWEWCHVAHFQSIPVKLMYVLFLLIGCALSWALPFELFVLMGCLLWIGLFIALYRYPKGSDFWQRFAFMRGLTGLLVLIAFLASLLSLKKASPTYILVLLLIVWLMDSAAYFAGQKWGKTPLAIHISPKKTKEGLIAAL